MVLLLYNTGLVVCRKLKQIIGVLACKFPHTKFVQSVAQNCIPNYPDKNLPTIFVYFEDNLLSQFCGPSVFGGESMTVKDVEWGLSECVGSPLNCAEFRISLAVGLHIHR